MVTATGEMRFPILPRLSGVLFVEAGNVWQDPWTVHLDDLLYDTGPGLRLETPFGELFVVDRSRRYPLESGTNIWISFATRDMAIVRDRAKDLAGHS